MGNWDNITEEELEKFIRDNKKKKLVEEHLKQNPKCGILVIDNIVHFLLNYNDPTESAQLNEWLIKIKADYNCHIILVLHENGSDMGNGKAKEHYIVTGKR